MNCPNCGAPLGENANSCPYCGCENFQFKKNQKESEITKIYQKIFSMLGLKDRITKKATKILTVLTVILVIGFLIAILYAFVHSIVGPKLQYARQQENLQKLEKIYQSADYDKLYDAIRKMGTEGYSSVYDKYYDVASLSTQLVRYEDGIEDSISYYKQKETDSSTSIGIDLQNLFHCLEKCKSQSDLGYPFDNENVYEDFKARILHLLRDEYLLTDEEIMRGLQQYTEGKDRDFSPYGKIILSRLKEDN